MSNWNVLGCVVESAIFTLNHTQSENFGISLKKLKREKCANTLEFKVINTDDVFPQILESLLFPGEMGRAVQKMQGSGKAIALKR